MTRFNLRRSHLLPLLFAPSILTSPILADTRFENSIAVYLSSKGQKAISDNLSDLLFLSGFDLGQGRLDQVQYQADQELRLDQLPVEFNQFKGTLGLIRDELGRCLKGFHLNDPKIQAKIQGLNYGAFISQMSLSIDTDASRQLPDGEGLVLLFKAELPLIQLEASELKLRDTNN